MTHLIALQRKILVRGPLEHIALTSYLFTTIIEVTRIKNSTAWWRIEMLGRMEDVHWSPGQKIEIKQYVVLIENEVPNLVLADSDFSMTDYSDGWT